MTEAGKKKGWGHWTRCKALAQAFEKNGFDVTMIIDTEKENESVFRGLPTFFLDWKKNTSQWDKYFRSANIVVIDSYLAKKSLYNKIANKKSCLPIYFDDYQRLQYPRGIVLNASVGTEKVFYPRSITHDSLQGGKYSLVRQEFWLKPDRRIRKKISHVLITFGGGEYSDFLLNLLEEISKLNLGLHFHVVVANPMSLRQFKNKISIKFYSMISARQMRNLMLKCDVAISGGGQTLNELCCCKLPVIGICFAENQKEHLKNWAKTGFVKLAGDFDAESKTILNVTKIITKLTSSNERKKMLSKINAGVDGQGAMRIVSYIKNYDKAEGPKNEV